MRFHGNGLRSIFLGSAGFLIIHCAVSAQDSGKKESSTSTPASVANAARFCYGNWHSSQFGSGGYVQNVVLCPSSPSRVYAYGDVFGVFRSDDGGRRWRMMHGSLPVSGQAQYCIRGLLVDPRNEDRLLIATGQQWAPRGGLFLSTDGGANWKKVLEAQFYGNEPFRSAGVILARNPQKPDEIVAASGGTGVWKSQDNGETWEKVGLEGIFPVDLIYAKDGSRLWLSAQKISLKNAKLEGGLYRSDDSGLKWAKLSDEAPSEMVQSPWNPGELYAIFGLKTIKVSADGGTTWSALGQGLPEAAGGKDSGMLSSSRFNALAVGPDFVVIASSKGEFWKLKAGEKVWQPVNAEGIEEIYEGKPWYGRIIPGKFRHFGAALGGIVIDPRNPQHWFFTDWYAIYQSTDAGAHWSLSIDGIEATVVHCLTQDPTDPGVVHLGMGDNGYLLSEDGGNRFAQPEQYMASNVKSIALSARKPYRVYAIGDHVSGTWEANQVFISDDRGRSWRRSPMTGLPAPERCHFSAIACDPADPQRIYLTVSNDVGPGKGGVYTSADGGVSWTSESDGLPPGAALFSHVIWNSGPELAVGPNDTRVAISQSHHAIYYWDRAAKSWKPSRVESSVPRAVAADFSREGIFYIADDNLGVLRSTDAGATWTPVYAGKARYIAVDQVHPDRIAAGIAEGVALSSDGGKTWSLCDAQLPYRLYPIPAFAGDRLVVGTTGNGAFWLPLNETAGKTVAAKEIPKKETE